MAYNAQQAGQPGPAYGQAYASGGAPPPAAAYGSGGSAPYGRAATGGYQGYPNTGGQPYGAPAAPYGAPPSAYGAPPSAYGAPYGGPPPPYPPTAPVCPPGSPGGAYPYAAQAQPMYGKPVNSTPSHLEMGGGASPPVSDEEKITDQISVEIRHAFVRKVLGILAIQILITFGVASAFGFIPAIRNFLLANYWLAIVAVVSAFVVQMVLVCVPDLARKVPTNFILMTLITLCYAVVLSCAAAASSRDAFLIAIGSTFVVVVGLMLFACQTKYDFTGAGTYLFVAMLCLMIFGLLCIFFSNRIMHLVYSSLATLLFCMMLVYDTQMVVGGKHRRYQYSIDDYIFAALTLYMDIIIIFMNILAIADNS